MTKCVRLILILLMGFSLAQNSYAQGNNRKEKLQQLKIRLQDEIELANKILSETRKSQNSSLGAIETVEQKLKLRQDLIRTIDRELEILDKDIYRLDGEVDTLQKRVEKLKDDYAKMIRQAYKSKNKYSRLMFLLSSRDFNQAIRRLEYLKQYSEFRRRQVEEVKKQQNELNEKIAELNRQKTRKAALRGQMEKEKSTLVTEKKSQEKAIADLRLKEKEITKELKEKQTEAKKLENEIQRIIAAEIRRAREQAIRRQIEDEAIQMGLVSGKDFTNRTSNESLKVLIDKKKKALAAANKPVKESNIPAYNLTPEATRLAANFAANRSRLPWPVERGLVVARFGPQQHPIAKSVIINNNGIDIATEKGSKARATFDGEVSRVIRTPGAALAVFIRHGNYFTVYNNLSEVYVKQGDNVKSMQEIGSVFFNELEGKTVLHFELWKELQVVDPLPWLSGK
ncbi:MAG: peptidoglycan DD-metalloendopeptidase family protein [Owenweeksia sp.]